MADMASLQSEALRQLKAIRYLRNRKPLTEMNGRSMIVIRIQTNDLTTVS